MGNGTDSRRENSYKFSHECINIKNISLQKRAAGGDRKKHRNPLSVQKLKGAAGRIGENSARHSSPKTRRRGCVQKIKRGETAVKLMQILTKIKQSRSFAPMLFLAAGMALIIAVFPYRAVCSWPISAVVTDREGIPLCGSLSSAEEWSLPIAYEQMGRRMPAVVVALEDRRFYQHNGIDAAAAIRALVQNSRAEKTISGGSTITSQVIRLSIERPRTIPNKIIEFWQAMTLEHLLTKEGILELYLNRAPFGGNIRGIEAAARAWFNKPAAELSLAEATLLAGILRGPSYYRPDRHPQRALALRNRLLDTLAKRGAATAEEAARAKLEPLPQSRFAIPAEFRQAAEKVIKSGGVLQKRDRFGHVRSTIDRSAQNLLQAELQNALSRLSPSVTAAAVLIENESGAVRGYIGNAREDTHSDASWVDCADSPRSPGSTLKPFIYALGFESGRLTPSLMTADTPLSMKGTAPRNYDRHFRGPVSVRSALADSLNVPAVRILRSEGGRRTIDLYRRIGFAHFTKDADWYGDSLALGGCEVTVLELAAAYRVLANQGTAAPLKWAENDEETKGAPAISPAACALVLDILKDSRRLMPLYSEIFGEEGTKIAFKTGTSFGLRDAWTAAVTKKYTLAVWFGDPTGRPHQSLVGLKIAAPAAVRIMRKLTPTGAKWFDLPSNVKERRVCALSGMSPNPLCGELSSGLYIENVSNGEPCSMHVSENGRAAVKWPPELEGFFSSERGESPVRTVEITSPRKNALYELSPGRERLPLTAEGGRGALYWFVDGELIETGGEGAFWQMTAGRHEIAVTDEEGSGAAVTIKVAQSSQRQEKEDLPLLEEVK